MGRTRTEFLNPTLWWLVVSWHCWSQPSQALYSCITMCKENSNPAQKHRGLNWTISNGTSEQKFNSSYVTTAQCAPNTLFQEAKAPILVLHEADVQRRSASSPTRIQDKDLSLEARTAIEEVMKSADLLTTDFTGCLKPIKLALESCKYWFNRQINDS